jgi:hypothetical protein
VSRKQESEVTMAAQTAALVRLTRLDVVGLLARRAGHRERLLQVSLAVQPALFAAAMLVSLASGAQVGLGLRAVLLPLARIVVSAVARGTRSWCAD